MLLKTENLIDKEIYRTTIGESILIVIGLLAQLAICFMLIIKGFWWISPPLFFSVFYYLYKNPLLFVISDNNLICWFIAGKKEYNYSDIDSAQITSLTKGARGIKIKFSDKKKFVVEYGSLNECVHLLNFLNKKNVRLIKNKLWNTKINGDPLNGFYIKD